MTSDETDEPLFVDVHAVVAALDAVDYLADDGLATALYLASVLGQPLVLEGEPGVGKTSAAKAMARALGTELIRLQCYEGIAANEALYEWNYARQILALQAGEDVAHRDVFAEEFLLDRPLLRAVRAGGERPPVVLIDEIDRADDEFEALLYEFLGELSVTVPEIGTFVAATPPLVVLTSNRTRELHDALKRRCLYHWIDHPSVARAAEIVRRNVPTSSRPLVEAAAGFVARARGLELDKPPGLAETIDWVAALEALGVSRLEGSVTSLGSLAKTPDDLAALQGLVDREAAG